MGAATATGTGCGTTGSTTTTGTSIRCCQYDTATPRCQKRGINNKIKMSWRDDECSRHTFGGHELHPHPNPADQNNRRDNCSDHIAREQTAEAAECVTEASADRFAHRALIAQHNVRFGEIEPDAEDGHDQKDHEQSDELHFRQEQFVGALRGFALQQAMQSKQCAWSRLAITMPATSKSRI